MQKAKRTFNPSGYTLVADPSRGVTLIDTLVGIALMLVVFVGINAVFRLSIDVVTNNKARAGAIALAGQRMEYIRSLSYAAVGTVGGIPNGNIPQSESVSANGVTYTRRTIIVYADDPKDGLGALDTNGIAADYKSAKVDLTWTSRYGGTRHVNLVARISPATSQGETNPCTSPCGPLTVNVVDSLSQPVAGASVQITNPTANPPINFGTFTNASGVVSLLVAPAVSGYSATASNSGYSSDQTYTPFTVGALGTSQTLRIDRLSSMTLYTPRYGTNEDVSGVAFTMHGTKTTTGPGVYKYSATLGGGQSATTTLTSMEWDTYIMSVNPATGYDLAYSCTPQPVSLPAGVATTTLLYLAPHTANSFTVKVVANASGALIPDAQVRLYKTGYDTTQQTGACGQTFFSGLSAGTYSIAVTAGGYTAFNASGISISGQTQYQAVMN